MQIFVCFIYASELSPFVNERKKDTCLYSTFKSSQASPLELSSPEQGIHLTDFKKMESVAYNLSIINLLNRFITMILFMFKYIYEQLPINLSTITGVSHLNLPRLKGQIILGRYYHINQQGLLANLIEASRLAKTHSSGACHFWLGANDVVLVTKPSHIRQILIFNDAHVSRNAGISDNIPRVLGKSIFFDDGALWQGKRQIWRQWLYPKEVLTNYFPCIQDLVSKYIDILEASSGSIIDLQSFFTRFTLDVAGRALMDHSNLAEIAEELAELLSKGLKTATSPCAVANAMVQELLQILSLGKEPVGLACLSLAIRDFFEKKVIIPQEEKFKVSCCLLRAILEDQSIRQQLDEVSISGSFEQ